MTLDELIETVAEFKEKYPFAGMNVVESPLIPKDHMVLMNTKQMAICYPDGKIVVVDIPPVGGYLRVGRS